MKPRAPADMIFAVLFAVFVISLLLFFFSECGRSGYGNLERVLAEAPTPK